MLLLQAFLAEAAVYGWQMGPLDLMDVAQIAEVVAAQNVLVLLDDK
jgi:hypothetical protein